MLILFSLAVFVSYLAYILVRYGIQPSISDSYYRLTQGGKWLFTISTWLYVLPLVVAGINGATYQDLMLLSAGFLLALVGVFPDFRVTSERKLHQVGAEGGILVAFLWMLTTPYWFVAVPSIVAIFVMFKKKFINHTWWIEVLAYLTITLAIYLNSL